VGAPFFEARSRTQLATTLLDRGTAADRAAATEHVDRAVELAQHHGFRAVQRRALHLIDN
jgi:hypothetical protein